MILESSYWKDPLLDSALRLLESPSDENFNEAEMVQIEKDIFIGFYAVRKLMDTIKIKDSTKNLKVKLRCSPNIKKVNLRNKHRIDELYNLKKFNQESRTLKFVCDQIVHSYIFMIEEKEDGKISGFYFTSDRDKEKKLYYITVQEVIDIFNLVGNDYPNNLHMVKNLETGEFNTKIW